MDSPSSARQEAQSKVRDEGLNPQDHPYLTDYYEGKILEERGRNGLKLEDKNQALTGDEAFIARYGAPSSTFKLPHFSLHFGIITPTFANLDLGLFLTPTTNFAMAFFYAPLDTNAYTNVSTPDGSGGYYYSLKLTPLPRELLYFEPRIKFYSAPSGLTSFHGFSFIYYGLHQGKYPDGYQDTN